ncbi:Peptide chain release factor 2 [uncultured Desulfobacterium sp.]|uniref:Peptide chain release factor 2 n=1 Tax=uncultured Desulfobacterium sp. TaxID=201089 RepID=A0A445MZZ5_9BACT|nr:Peptide chain release factor 2 [uncultured Desulfobacterium sp.]
MNSEVIFDLAKQEQELAKIENIMAGADFWQKDQEEISRLGQERSCLCEQVDQWNRFHREAEDARILAEIAAEEDDESTIKEIQKDIAKLQEEVNHLEFLSLFGEPDDRRNAIVAINAGAGGTEAQDWVEMLFRMYTRWSEEKAMKVQVMDYLPGDEAGIKNVTFNVIGPYAYGYLKSEHGVHRMVRVSPFDATRRRHTSFASVSVLPEVDTDIKVNIEDKDLRIDTFRASGPGGQHVNKTSSAIRITHLPTGIVVQCQNEKSQHRNKDMAMKVLMAKLYNLEKAKLDEKKQERHDSQDEIGWGRQIRSYVFNPYRLVKDHRTNVEVGNLERVMDGDVNMFMDAYLKQRAKLQS